MSHLLALLVGYLLISLGYALFSLRTTKSLLFRTVALGYLLVSIGWVLYFYNQLLSLPKPIDQEFFNNAKEAVVLAVRPKSDSAVYLWLQLPDRDYPSYYVMPWNGRAAEELEIAQREAAQQEGLVIMKHPFHRNPQQGIRGVDKDPVFYAAPPPRPPEKMGELHPDSPIVSNNLSRVTP
jgi:hypothetical protein